MKLREAMEKATPGPLELVRSDGKLVPTESHGHYYGIPYDSLRVKRWGECDLMGDYQGCIVADVSQAHGCQPHAYDESNANAALLTHWYNHGPKLLEALKRIANIPCCGGYGRCGRADLSVWIAEEAIEAAEEVEGI